MSPAPRRGSTALGVVLVGLLIAAAVAPPAAASPRPVPVCGVCSDRLLSSTATSQDLSLTVESSSATVQIHENGSATWTARVQLGGSGVDDLQSDSTLATDLVASAVYRDAVAVSGRVVDGTLVARYRVPAFATRVHGAYRLDGLRDQPGRLVYTDLGADRLTVIGPESTTAVRAPSSAAVGGNRVRLSRWQDGWVVFAPNGLGGVLAGTLAVADAVGAVFVWNVVRYLLVPAVVLLGGLLVALRVTRAVDDRTGGDGARPQPRSGLVAASLAQRRGVALAALGVVAVAHPLWVGVQPVINDSSPLLLSGGVAALLLAGVVATVEELSFRTALAASVVAYVVGALAAFSVAALVGGPFHRIESLGAALVTTLPVLSVVCCLPLGVVADVDSRPGVGIVVGTFALAVAARAQLFEQAFFGLLATVLFVVTAVGVALCGVPFLLVGRAAAD